MVIAQVDEQQAPWSRTRCTQPERRTVSPIRVAHRRRMCGSVNMHESNSARY
jgi:hypothetical protein